MVKRRTPKKDKPWTSAAARRLINAAGNAQTVEQAVQIVATNILDGIPCPPTDLNAIKPRLRIKEFCPEDMSVSGELRPDGDGFKVIYASHLSPSRRRFTIAHEMGHAFFETTGPNCPRFGEELERICDMLATEILMPKDIFLQRAGHELSIQKVFELARLFDTSLVATAIRCAELQRVSVFEVEDKSITWGYGVVRTGSLNGITYGLGQVIREAQDSNAGDTNVYLNNHVWSGEWKLEWTRIGQGTRTLFLLRPASGYYEMRKHHAYSR
jgi:hypothetical protein